MKPLLYIGLVFGVIAIIFTVVLFALYPLKYKEDINAAAALYNVDPVLIASIINAESSFKPDVVSNKGAVGLMQVMPATAEWVGKQININVNSETLKNPQINIFIGTYYLKYLLEKFKDEKTALIAYNAGEGNVRTWLTDGRYCADTNAEEEGKSVLISCPYPVTNKYVEKVMNGLNFYKSRI